MMQRDQEEILAPTKAAHLPIMITQGDQDPVVPVANTRTWAKAMDELGMEHEYIEMAGRDHGNIIWDGMPSSASSPPTPARRRCGRPAPAIELADRWGEKVKTGGWLCRRRQLRCRESPSAMTEGRVRSITVGPRS